jgi:hypothetical protein
LDHLPPEGRLSDLGQVAHPPVLVDDHQTATLASDDDIVAMVEMDDRTYEYRRVGHDQRPLVFRGDGTFAAGDAGRERYWAIRDGRLLVCGDDGHLTMNLERKADGSWHGRWLVYEKMPIVREPKP